MTEITNTDAQNIPEALVWETPKLVDLGRVDDVLITPKLNPRLDGATIASAS